MDRYCFRVKHMPTGKFMNKGADGYLDFVGHIWDSKRGAKRALGHVRRRCERSSWRQDWPVSWVTDADDCVVVKYVLVEAVQVTAKRFRPATPEETGLLSRRCPECGGYPCRCTN